MMVIRSAVVSLLLCLLLSSVAGAAEEKAEAGKAAGATARAANVDYKLIGVIASQKTQNPQVANYLEQLNKICKSTSGSPVSFRLVSYDKMSDANPRRVGFLLKVVLDQANFVYDSSTGRNLQSFFVTTSYDARYSDGEDWQKLGSGKDKIWFSKDIADQFVAWILNEAVTIKVSEGKKSRDNVALKGTLKNRTPLQFESLVVSAPYSVNIPTTSSCIPLVDHLAADTTAVPFEIQAPITSPAAAEYNGRTGAKVSYVWKKAYVAYAGNITYGQPPATEEAKTEGSGDKSSAKAKPEGDGAGK